VSAAARMANRSPIIAMAGCAWARLRTTVSGAGLKLRVERVDIEMQIDFAHLFGECV